MRKYYGLVLMVGNYASSCDFRKFLDIPLKTADQEESSLLALFKFLQDQGRVCEGFQLLKMVQCFRLDITASQKLHSDYIHACTMHNAQNVVWYYEGQARLLLATLLANGTDTQRAKSEFNWAISTFDRAPVPEALNRLDLEVKLAQIRSDWEKCPSDKLALWTALLDDKLADDYSTTAYALQYSFEAALDVHNEDPSKTSQAIALQLQTKIDRLYEKVGDLCSLYIFHAYTADAASERFDALGDVLKWHENFDKTYPTFSLWDIQIAVKMTQNSIYISLNDYDSQCRTTVDIMKIKSDRESFWSEDFEGPQAWKERGPLMATDGKFENVLGRDTEVDEQEGPFSWSEWQSCLMVIENDHLGPRSFESRYVELSTATADNLEPFFTTLHRWFQNASKTAELTDQQLGSILMFRHDEDSDMLAAPPTRMPGPKTSKKTDEPAELSPPNMSSYIGDLTPKSLRDRLLGSPNSLPPSLPPSDIWEKGFGVLSDWLLRTDRYFETKRHALLAKLFWRRTCGGSSFSCLTLEDQIHEKHKFLELLLKLNDEARQLFNFHAILCRIHIAQLKIAVVRAQDGPLCDDTSEEFLEILAMCESAREESRKSGNSYLESSSIITMVVLFQYSALTFCENAFTRFYKCFIDAEQLIERRRVGLKALSGWDKVDKLLQSLQETDWPGLVSTGLSVVNEIPDSQQARRDRLIWGLVQFSHSLGLGWLVLTNMTNSSDQETEDLSLRSLEEIAIDSGSDVVFVEWIGPLRSSLKMQPFQIVVSHQGGPPRAQLINLPWAEVESIIKQFSDFDEENLVDDEALQVLRKLDPLVEYLSQTTSPGQVLVLCPFAGMNSLPLHALQVDGQLLIRRNPIVYTSSMTVLNVAFLKRKAYEEKAVSSQRRLKAAVFGAPPNQAGQEALQAVARKFSSPACTDGEFTASNFCTAIHDGVDVLHFHGHGTHNREDPKANGLIFHNHSHLTLCQVFDLSSTTTTTTTTNTTSDSQVPSPFHATLLACESGTSQRDLYTNDIIGLVPAFLYAGASSTLSALWSFSDADAALFSHAFYQAFDGLLFDAGNRSDNGDGNGNSKMTMSGGRDQRVDLARATQRAILAIMRQKPELYHWGPFVLNGYWMFGVGGRD
jgi:CHAT domain-containing protein